MMPLRHHFLTKKALDGWSQEGLYFLYKTMRESRYVMSEEQIRANARQLAQNYLKQGDETGWFEALYASAEGEVQVIPWADQSSNPNLLAWLEQHNVQGEGRRALVVGCGLGDDAEELARRGFQVVAFDIAPSAIAWCKQRFPTSSVEYVTADVLAAPEHWKAHFDFVFESYTLQVLPIQRARAITAIADFVAEAGILLLICRGREPEEPAGNMPWPLTRADLQGFVDAGLHVVQFEDYLDSEDPPKRRFRVQYQR
jgi:SAM-dependent methyltransferase